MRAFLLAASAFFGLTAAASAVEISSGSRLNIGGNANFTATTITFTNPAQLLTGAGDFAALGTCTSCVTMTAPLTYSPPATGLAYTATNNALTTDFTIGALLSQTGTPGTTLGLVYSGTATLTGFDPTPGEWALTLNQFGNVFGSFSATTAPIAEPWALAVFGTGLVGLAFLKRRRPLA